jgi:integrase
MGNYKIKGICDDARIKYGWGRTYDPFFELNKPKSEKDPYEKICPFSFKEQNLIVAELPDHWKPFFRFAFASGLSQGEQVSLKLGDIDWKKKTMRIERALTRNKED